MPGIISTTTVPWPIVVAVLVVASLLALSIGLWTFFGTTVFFEMVRTGWLACF